MVDAAYSAEDFRHEADVSRETFALFEQWHALLLKWNRAVNLVSPRDLEQFWQRHALDSWQLVERMPKRVMSAIDLGSGAGFPGIAVGIALKQRGEGRVLLVESAGKKANFLRTAAREMGLPVDVTDARAESLPEQGFDLVTARAFAPMPRLLGYAHPFWCERTVGLFLKGENVADEVAAASRDWSFTSRAHPSRSSPSGVVLEVRELCKRREPGLSPTKLA